MEPRRVDSPARKLMAGQKIMERTIILFDCAARDRMHDGGKAEMWWVRTGGHSRMCHR